MKKSIIESMESGLIKSIKSVREGIKRRKDNQEWNKKRYWQLTASERLHYDSFRKEIMKENSSFFNTTITLIGFFSLLFMVLATIKFLGDFQREIFIKMMIALLPAIILVLKMAIFVDLVILMMQNFIIKPSKIKNLNKNYGFKN